MYAFTFIMFLAIQKIQFTKNTWKHYTLLKTKYSESPNIILSSSTTKTTSNTLHPPNESHKFVPEVTGVTNVLNFLLKFKIHGKRNYKFKICRKTFFSKIHQNGYHFEDKIILIRIVRILSNLDH
jgi:hypothetical protein